LREGGREGRREGGREGEREGGLTLVEVVENFLETQYAVRVARQPRGLSGEREGGREGKRGKQRPSK